NPLSCLTLRPAAFCGSAGTRFALGVQGSFDPVGKVSVRTITAKRASGPVRYLLSADRTLRKLSLKRLPSARTLTRRRRRSIRRTHAVPSGTVHTHPSRSLTSLTFFAIMFLTVGVALIAARARLEPARPDVEDVASTPANALDVAEPVQSAPPVVVQASTDGS